MREREIWYMKKKQVFFCTFLLLAYLTVGCSGKTAPVQENSQENFWKKPMEYQGQILLRMILRQKEGHPSVESSRYFAKLVEEKTESRIRIVLEPWSPSKSEDQIAKEIEHGSLELTWLSVDSLTGYNQQLTVLEMPFLYESREHMWKILNGEIGKSFLKSMESRGIKGLCWYDAGPRNLYMVHGLNGGAKELERLRIQVNGSAFMMDIISTMGALPMDLSDRDMREALKKGQADGVENDITSFMAGGLYELASHGILTEHARIPEMLIMNYRAFCQLEENEQQAVMEAAEEASNYQKELWEQYEKEQMESLKKSGVTWQVPENLEELQQKVESVYEIYGQSYLELIERIKE